MCLTNIFMNHATLWYINTFQSHKQLFLYNSLAVRDASEENIKCWNFLETKNFKQPYVKDSVCIQNRYLELAALNIKVLLTGISKRVDT